MRYHNLKTKTRKEHRRTEKYTPMFQANLGEMLNKLLANPSADI